ncbi:hypothetical protein QVD17_41622 [Tagetes erecta]|uniref:Uncharacterized protein n=1 Tax=Tagetes erecta TaxID=13708 RepID=A0AAD8JM61_TARER|nr:hypothetical protein QVD17_41622 [Tagetes erecta]
MLLYNNTFTTSSSIAHRFLSPQHNRHLATAWSRSLNVVVCYPPYSHPSNRLRHHKIELVWCRSESTKSIVMLIMQAFMWIKDDDDD